MSAVISQDAFSSFTNFPGAIAKRQTRRVRTDRHQPARASPTQVRSIMENTFYHDFIMDVFLNHPFFRNRL